MADGEEVDHDEGRRGEKETTRVVGREAVENVDRESESDKRERVEDEGAGGLLVHLSDSIGDECEAF